MNDQFRIPDPETRAKLIASLKAASRLLDLSNLQLDEAIAFVEKDLREQQRARLLYKSNSIPANKIDS
jgi:Mg/Co/Ni transporter MgtE